MAFFNKVWMLVLNSDDTKFLVCQKDRLNVTNQYILPGWRIEEYDATFIDCLVREIDEELGCQVNMDTLEYLWEYVDVAAWMPDKNVSIKLYKWELIWQPAPSNEIKYLHWIGKEQLDDEIVSPIIKNKIMPDLLERWILK